MWLQDMVAAALLIALIVYVLTGGADYGSGVWDLLARGPRATAQRRLIEKSIGPIWEADHVWLILVVVILFVGFPRAYATICTTLHLPLLGMLLGIVLRGAAFSFRAYGPGDPRFEHRWDRVFALASTITPLLLGVTVGALAQGQLRPEPARIEDFIDPWFGTFPFAVGIMTLAIFAYLAAVYATVQAPPGAAVAEDFRRRAIGSAVIVGAIAGVVLLLSRDHAPVIWQGLTQRRWTWPLIWATTLLALGALYGLWSRRYELARFCAAGQIVLTLIGWGAAQFPYLIVPTLTIQQAASDPRTLKLLVGALLFGAVVLIPSFGYLYRLFVVVRTEPSGLSGGSP
ncbi:MAG: cytochrome d ubiquinol oxidase subunit II [Candidatus Binataceae bacterium]